MPQIHKFQSFLPFKEFFMAAKLSLAGKNLSLH
jgi:hypothetical protein